MTTPAIRLLLGYPELVAVGTPLVTIIPTAVTGSIAYTRRGLADVRAGLAIGIVGAPASVLGAYAASLIGGRAILVATPTHAHVEPCVDALAAGKHVFCESPLGSTLDECRAIVKAARGAAGAVATRPADPRHAAARIDGSAGLRSS